MKKINPILNLMLSCAHPLGSMKISLNFTAFPLLKVRILSQFFTGNNSVRSGI